jgi:translation initiation factor 5A
MSDDEHHDVHFESTDSGASKTFPMQAGSIRKNGYIVIKGRPCKVVDVSTSKTGKHGHAKCNFTALDIFTNKKMEDLQPSSHNCEVPNVSRTDYTLIDISDDGFCSLMTDSGDTKDDLSLPKGTDELDKLAEQIQADFDEGKEVVVSVLAVRVCLIFLMCYHCMVAKRINLYHQIHKFLDDRLSALSEPPTCVLFIRLGWGSHVMHAYGV